MATVAQSLRIGPFAQTPICDCFRNPTDYVGEKSFAEGYTNCVKSLSNTDGIYYEVRFAQCPEGVQDVRVFPGQRKDSFSVALVEIFNLVILVPLASALPDDPARNDLADKNVVTLALEVHEDCLTSEENGVVGAWTTSRIRSTQTVSPDSTYRQPIDYPSEFRQGSRLSNPLVNEVVIGLLDKNLFNSSEPEDYGQFAPYVTSPTLPAILDLLIRDAVGATDNIAPWNLP